MQVSLNLVLQFVRQKCSISTEANKVNICLLHTTLPKTIRACSWTSCTRRVPLPASVHLRHATFSHAMLTLHRWKISFPLTKSLCIWCSLAFFWWVHPFGILSSCTSNNNVPFPYYSEAWPVQPFKRSDSNFRIDKDQRPVFGIVTRLEKERELMYITFFLY